MNCRKIQELLKTGYLDGRLNRRQKEEIDQHLEICRQCRSLEKKLQSQRTLFKNIGRKDVPEKIWHNIREAILVESLYPEAVVAGGVFQRLRKSIFIPRPVFALAGTCAMLILILAFTGITIYYRQASIESERGEIIADCSFSADIPNNIDDLGTNIEQYFL